MQPLEWPSGLLAYQIMLFQSHLIYQPRPTNNLARCYNGLAAAAVLYHCKGDNFKRLKTCTSVSAIDGSFWQHSCALDHPIFPFLCGRSLILGCLNTVQTV